MIVVTKIEIVEVPSNEWVFTEVDEELFPLFHPDRGPVPPQITNIQYNKILVQGREYHYTDRGARHRVTIGWHPQVHHTLRIPLEVIDDMQTKIDRLRKERNTLKTQVHLLQTEIARKKRHEILFRRFIGVLQ